MSSTQPDSAKATEFPWLVRIALMGPMLLWYGYALSVLWGWFLVPLGLPAVSPLQAAGIDLLVAFVLSQFPTRREFGSAIEVNSKGPWFRLCLRVTIPALTLGFGWLIHWGATL